MVALTELWAAIPRTGGAYEASSNGRVRRVAGGQGSSAGRILKPTMKQGYAWVVWMVDGVRHNSGVHSLVAEAFLRLPEPGEEINHKNGEHAANWVDNLEWVSHSENMKHAYRTLGRQIPPSVFRAGSQHPGSKLTEAAVVEIKQLLDAGEQTTVLARRYGVSRPLISQIKTGRAWRHVDDPDRRLAGHQ